MSGKRMMRINGETRAWAVAWRPIHSMGATTDPVALDMSVVREFLRARSPSSPPAEADGLWHPRIAALADNPTRIRGFDDSASASMDRG